jgi:FG-GAP-like repeat/Abnormal spindle-like microcephaly-assoc'd, ASPM-SPD-2-Hydin
MPSVRQRYAFRLLACILWLLMGSPASAQTYVFGTAAYPAPGIPSTSPPRANPVMTADFNKDGIPDVAILGEFSTAVQVLSIFIGKPDGTFASRVDYPVQGTGFALADFNGDGKLDVVVVGNLVTPTASLLLGNGDGTFQAAVPLNPNISGSYTAVAAADLNGDGKADLVVLTSNYGSGATLAVLLGNGDGTFQPPVTYSVTPAPYIVLADFTGDGRPDIALAGPVSGGQNEVSILINQGDGTLQSPVNYPVSGIIEALAAADLNGDGKPDLIVPTGGTSASVSILLGNGDGTFGNSTVYTSSLLDLYASQVAIADFNGDGKADLALTNSQANDVAILLGNGDGTFQNPPKLYSGGLQPSAVLALDANGDGKPDLALAGGYSFDSSLSVSINRGDGSFPSRVTYQVLSDPYSAVAADFNGDARPDIATTSFSQSGGVSALIGNAGGTFQPHLDSSTEQAGTLPYPTILVPSVVAAGDFNNDRNLDLVVAGTQQTSSGSTFPVLTTLVGNGDGTFQDNPNINQVLTNSVQSLAAGDFNGDGSLDIAATAINTSNASIFLGNGDGTFAAPLSVSVGPMLLSPPYHNVLADDFNGDGKADLAVATDNGIAVLLGNGNATFQAANLIPSLAPSDPSDELLALGDFNGDGKLDVVKGTQTNILNVALGGGDGTFQNAAGFQFPSILNFQSAAVGDFNGDGKLDVAFVSQSSNVMTVLLGNGDGTFCCEVHYDAGSISNNVRFMAAADFGGDGAAGLAFANFGDATVSVFMNAPVASFAPRELTFTSQNVGSTSAAQTITLSNPGSAPLDVNGISANGDFSETSDCPAKLSPAAACHISVTFSPAATGARTGTLTFAGNASVVPETLALSGTGAAAPDFAIAASSGSSTSATAKPGATATYSLSIAPVAGFNQTVSLTCSGAPPSATCSISPSAVTLNGTTAASVNVSVATTAPSAAVLPLAQISPLPPAAVWAALLGLLACLSLAFAHRWPSRVTSVAPVALLAVAIVFLASCGGGASSSTEPSSSPGTPSGPYTLVITGTSGSLSHSQSLTLVISAQ